MDNVMRQNIASILELSVPRMSDPAGNVSRRTSRRFVVHGYDPDLTGKTNLFLS